MPPLNPEEYNKRYVGWFYIVSANNEKKIEDATLAAIDKILKPLKNHIDLFENREKIADLSEKINQVAAVKLVKKHFLDERRQIIMEQVDKLLAESGSPIVDSYIDEFKNRLEKAPNPLVQIADSHMDKVQEGVRESIKMIKKDFEKHTLDALMAKIDDALDQFLGTGIRIG
ncbi:MAG: hypothetical protein SFW63_07350 [Alphaproteobacteria bacterium]|nr:hypothetical protein [Alphaproteobacteria bacterium]